MTSQTDCCWVDDLWGNVTSWINLSIYCPPLVNRFGMVCRPLGTNRQERCSGVIMRMLECREEMRNWKKIPAKWFEWYPSCTRKK